MGIFNQSYQHPLDESRDKFIELIKIVISRTHGVNSYDPGFLYSHLLNAFNLYKSYFEDRGVMYWHVQVDRIKWWPFRRDTFHVVVKVKISPTEPLFDLVDVEV